MGFVRTVSCPTGMKAARLDELITRSNGVCMYSLPRDDSCPPNDGLCNPPPARADPIPCPATDGPGELVFEVTAPTPVAFLAAIEEASATIEACYEEQKAAHPSQVSAGTMRVQLTIEPDGSVSAVTVSPVSPVVDRCAVEALKGVRFQPVDHRVTVRHDLALSR